MEPKAITKKGNELPLMNLKSKKYLLVAHRILWLNDDVDRFNIYTEFLKVDDKMAIARAKVTLFNEAGVEVKSATATKQESIGDFKDFIEKAETGAIGRAVTLLGFGTAFALADLEEGSRIIDAPLAAKTTTVTNMKVPTTFTAPVVTGTALAENLSAHPAQEAATQVAANTAMPGPKKSTFRKPSTTPATDGGWK